MTSQILTALVSLLSTLVIALLGAFTPKLKKIVDEHLSTAQAAKFNAAVDGLTTLADNVVSHFNESVVNDAKKSATWDAQLAETVKADAMSSLKSQGSLLLSQVQAHVPDIESFVEQLIVGAVGRAKK